MLTGFNKLANNDIPNAVKPLTDAMNQLNNNMVEIAINTGENLKNIVDAQNKLQTVIQKALFEEFGNVTLFERFNETDQKLKKIGDFLTATGINVGFNEELNKKLEAIFQKAGTSPQEISTLNTTLSETQKSIKNINQNLAGLRLNVQDLFNSENPDPSQIIKLKDENFKLLGQVSLLNNEKLKLEKKVTDITEKINKNSLELDLEKQSLIQTIALTQQANRDNQLKIATLIKEKADEAARNTETVNKFKEEIKELVDESVQSAGENEDIKEILKKREENINELFQGKGINQIFIRTLELLRQNSVDIETAKGFIKQMPLFGQLGQIKSLTNSLQTEMDKILNTAVPQLSKNNEVLNEVIETTNIQRRSVKEESKVDIKEENKKKFFENKKEDRLKAQNERRSQQQQQQQDTIITDAPPSVPQESTPQVGTKFEAPTTPQITPTQQTPVFQAAQPKPVSRDEQDELERRFGFTEEDTKSIIDLRERSADIKSQIQETKEELNQLQKESVKLNRLIRAGIDAQSNSQKLRRVTDRIGELTNQRTRLFEDRKELKKLIDLQQREFLEEQGRRNLEREETIQQILDLNKIDKETKKLQKELKFKEFLKQKAAKQREAKLNAKAKINFLAQDKLI